MKILIIEDNIHKRKKIQIFLEQTFQNLIIREASSYSSGIEIAENEIFDFLILDMSMPTADITNTDGGGRFRVFGGREILKRLKRKKKLLQFIILTQFSKFDETSETKTLSEIEIEINDSFSLYSKGIIFYDTTSSIWKEKLKKVIEEL